MLRKEHVENSQRAVSSKPLHPGMAVLPVALLLGAFVGDLAHLGIGVAEAAQISLWLAGCALASSGLLAMFRLTDFFTIRRVQPQNNGLLLALGNLLALGLLVVSIWARLENAEMPVRQGSLLLSLAAAGLMLMTDVLPGQAKLRHVFERDEQRNRR